MSPFTIHTVPASPYARAVLATLEEKGAPWRLAPLKPGEHRGPDHLARHPFGRMPVLEHEGFTLYETQAILRYLDRVLPSPPLTPPDPRAAARMDQVMGVNDCYRFAGCANVIVFQRIVGPRFLGLPTDEAAIVEAMPRARTVIAELSRLLGAQPFFAGDALSLADLLLAPHLDLFAATPEWRELAVPNLEAWLARMLARPSLQETAMERLMAA